jgi:hypothetical protein
MATASRHASGPHGSGASLEELRGWRALPTRSGGAPSSAWSP